MRSFVLALLLALLCFPGHPRAQIQCYGTVQSTVTDAAGNIDVALVPTPPATTQPCPSPCNPDPTTKWTYLTLPAGSPARDLVYSAALAGVLSGKPVYVSASPGGAGGNCQINVFQLKNQ
jgi:hypothetical protein